MQEKTTTVYISNDGKEFTSAEQCALYEAGLTHTAKVNAYLDDRYGVNPTDRGITMRKTTSRSILTEWEAERDEFMARFNAGEFATPAAAE
ncbi:MAG: hypothetical protein HC888_01050 [Candidatus Competibacteraceae bacterium]|nr:hypothetical protein [Candidatus Competibacteraceae bacterium]